MSKFEKKVNIWTTIAVLAVFIAVVVTVFAAGEGNSLKRAAVQSARSGGEYLMRALDEEGGVFIYEADAITGRSLGGYNMLRHAGTTYAMLELFEETGDKNLLEEAESALEFLESRTRQCFGMSEEFRCLVDGSRKIKLGGNALAVLAYTKHAEVTGEDTYIPEAISLARWMIETQASDGEFTRHIELIDTGELDDHISDYYPGEAIFALARLSEITDDPKWLSSAELAADWLINVRDSGKTEDELLHDHWLLYGLSEIYGTNPKDLYLEHARKITNSIIDSQNTDLEGVDTIYNGGYGENPRSTPASTRTEGLAAAYSIFEAADDEAQMERIERAIERGVEFIMRNQMTETKIEVLEAHSGSLGGFTESLDDYNIRIDYVQHAISALLGYANL